MSSAITAFRPRLVDEAAAHFARTTVARVTPTSAARARALLFAVSRLGAFAISVGLELTPPVCLHPSVIERFIVTGCGAMAPATRATLRTNLRAVAKAVLGGPQPVLLSRERSKAPYNDAEIASYLALADTQPSEARRHRAAALICLGAGAGLMGTDLRGVRGHDVTWRSGGLVVEVRGARPRAVPVLAGYHDRLAEVAGFFGERFVVGGLEPSRRNVTTPLIASLSGGADLPRIELGRLRSTWLVACAETIGLKAFMDAAGISCSQRLGDLVASLPTSSEEAAVALLGARQ